MPGRRRAWCSRDGDWLFPTYRDTVADRRAAASTRSRRWRCCAATGTAGYDPHAHNVAPQATPLATQLLHAVGFAHAARLRGEDTVVLAMCGDGATSEGDFHEALNFAAVFHLPVVFFVQNNEYAISVPLARQTAAPSLAHKAIGYGMPGERVDGNDLAALLAVLGAGRRPGPRGRRARSSSRRTPTACRRTPTPTTPPATATDDEVAPWLDRDPLMRLDDLPRGAGLLDDAAGERGRSAPTAERSPTTLRDGADRRTPEPDPADLFAHRLRDHDAAAAGAGGDAARRAGRERRL